VERSGVWREEAVAALDIEALDEADLVLVAPVGGAAAETPRADTFCHYESRAESKGVAIPQMG
jgi:hypothetical protein